MVKKQRGPGRPASGAKKIVGISLSSEILADLKIIEDGLGMNTPEVVRSLILEHLSPLVQRAQTAIAKRKQVREQADQSDE